MPNLNINMTKSTCYRMLFLGGLEKRRRKKDNNNKAQCTINHTGAPEVLSHLFNQNKPAQLQVSWSSTAVEIDYLGFLFICLRWV